MRQHRDFRGPVLTCFEILNLQIWRQNAPIKIENRQRNQDDNKGDPLRQLPTRSLQLPGGDHHSRKGHG